MPYAGGARIGSTSADDSQLGSAALATEFTLTAAGSVGAQLARLSIEVPTFGSPSAARMARESIEVATSQALSDARLARFSIEVAVILPKGGWRVGQIAM